MATNKYHELAKEKGWWDPVDLVVLDRAAKYGPEDDAAELVLAKIALIHSELSEAVEAAREGEFEMYTQGGKPEGVAAELADAVIRIYDLAGALGVNLDDVIIRKHSYNATRPHRHGGKLA